MTLPVVLTPEAEADLNEAAQWYEQRSPGRGVELAAQVRQAVARIASNPELYGETHDGVRRAPLQRFPYGVFYRRRDGRIEVIAVYHDRRDPTCWQRRV